MSFEWIGLATLIVGVLCLLHGRRFAIFACIIATLLGAAAASILTALGSANIPPAHVLLLFLLLVALRSPYRDRLPHAFAWPEPGFWLALTAIYAVAAAIFLPRLFAGATYVFTIARTDAGPGLLLTPLGPVSGNLTQTGYLIGNVICFGIFHAFARDGQGKRWMTQALLVAGCCNIGFAALDYLTFFTGTAEAIAFMRNATYRMLDTAEVVGIKRLVGSFPEASAFATTTLALFAFSLTLWLNGHRSRIAGPLALLLFLALVLSTSTTAYVGLTIYLVLTVIVSVVRLIQARATANRWRFVIVTPILAGILAGAVLLNGNLSAAIGDGLQQLIFTKGSSASAIERGNWNSQALINFSDSFGLGVGVGSARASNTVIAVLANIGIVGALTYGAFVIATLVAPWSEPDPDLRVCREAAGSTCLAIFICGCLAGTNIDLGLIFFICAALAASPTIQFEGASALRARARAPSRARRATLAPPQGEPSAA